MPDLDFAGFTREAAAAFKPHYEDVVRRAGRRRRTAVAATAAVAVAAVAVGGGYVVTRTAGPPPARPAVTPSPSTAVPGVIPEYAQQPVTPKPGLSWHEVQPGLWDPVHPDVPLTGLFSTMIAGDLDHLYLEYQDCAADPCARMLAASPDGGRTWHKRRLPEAYDGAEGRVLLGATGRTVVAGLAEFDPRRARPDLWQPLRIEDTFHSSTDGGATWRAVAPRPIAAVPRGWPIFTVVRSVVAYDPAGGDLVYLASETAPRDVHLVQTGLPPEAGIWTYGADPSGGFAMISRDGGATWQRRALPEPLWRERGGTSLRSDMVTTVDGVTAYAVAERDNLLRVFVTTDGGATWKAGAQLTPDGPLMSTLATREGAFLLETIHGVYRSTDGGMTLREMGPSLGGADAVAVPGGYAEPRNDNAYGIWLSPDGGQWTYVPPPPVP
jgi:hypothetical protein